MTENYQFLFNSFQRLRDFPLEKNSRFETENELKIYLATDKTVYEGQIISVISTKNVYIILKEENKFTYKRVGISDEEVAVIADNIAKEYSEKLYNELNPKVESNTSEINIIKENITGILNRLTELEEFQTKATEDIKNLQETTKEIKKDYATREYVDSLNHTGATIVTSKNEVKKEQVLYLILSEDETYYEQWMLIGGQPTKIGTTNIDLSGFATKEDFENAVGRLDTLLKNAPENFDTLVELAENKQNKLTGSEFKTLNGQTILAVEGEDNDIKISVSGVDEDAVRQLFYKMLGESFKEIVDPTITNEIVAGIEGDPTSLKPPVFTEITKDTINEMVKDDANVDLSLNTFSEMTADDIMTIITQGAKKS